MEDLEDKQLEEEINALITNWENSRVCNLCGKLIYYRYKDRLWAYLDRVFVIDESNFAFGDEIEHHTDYKNNKCMVICKSCHAKIHFSSDPNYTKYRPVDKRNVQKKKYKLAKCSGCDGKVRVNIDENIKDINHFCSNCKRRITHRQDKFLEMWYRKKGYRQLIIKTKKS